MTTTNTNRSFANVAHRAALARETGRWPAWRHHNLGQPEGGRKDPDGWLSRCASCSENGVFAVLRRNLQTPMGAVLHLAIATPAGGGAPTWAEKMRIKDELAGRPRVAVEVFPPRADLVDGADMHHLWVLLDLPGLPFGLHMARGGDAAP